MLEYTDEQEKLDIAIEKMLMELDWDDLPEIPMLEPVTTKCKTKIKGE